MIKNSLRSLGLATAVAASTIAGYSTNAQAQDSETKAQQERLAEIEKEELREKANLKKRKK